MGKPGRPPKYDGPVKRIYLVLPYEVVLEMEKDKGDLPWGDYIISLFYEHKQRQGAC